MTVNQLRTILAKYPAGYEVKLYQGTKKIKGKTTPIITEFETEHISENVDEIEDGVEEDYILINAPIN